MAAAQKIAIQTFLTKPLKPCQPTKPCDGTKPASASRDRHGSSLTPVFAFIVLGANCAAAIYNSRHDHWAVAFVLASFLILVSLFYALRVFETLPRGSPRRAHAKAAVWSLSTVLTLMFSHRVAALLPLPVAVVVWVMTGSTIFAGFYMLFVCRDDGGATEEAPAKLADIAYRTEELPSADPDSPAASQVLLHSPHGRRRCGAPRSC